MRRAPLLVMFAASCFYDWGVGSSAPPADGSSCATVAQQGSVVPITNAGPAPPTATGGQISDGTYVVTSAVAYYPNLPQGQRLGTIRATLKVAAGSFSIVTDSTGVTGEMMYQGLGSYAISGSRIEVNVACPMPAIVDYAFSSTSVTTFDFFVASVVTGTARTVVLSFTKM